MPTSPARPLTGLLAAAAMAALALVPPSATAVDPGVATSPTSPAAAAGLGPWTAVSAPALALTQSAGLARNGGDLQVVWSQDDGDTHSVRSRTLDADALPAGGVTEVVSGWAALINDPKVLVHDGDLMAVFSGIRSTSGPEKYVGYAFFATSTNGATWTLADGTLSQTQSAGNASVTDAIEGAGEPMWGMGGFGDKATMHRGTSTTFPAGTPDFFTTGNGCCPTLDLTFANDRGTGDVYVGWTNLSGNTPETAGVFVQRVWPQPGGPVLPGPGSANGGQSLGAGMPGFVAERVGGGVWAAYRLGYPTSNTIRVWEVGTANSFDVTSASTTVDDVTLTAAPGGRLWLSWRGVGDGMLYAARTDRDVTRIGAVRRVAPPGDGFIWNIATDGENGPLDVVANIQAFDESPRLYATQVLPGLTAKAKPRRLNKGDVTIRVTDAGEPVPGARVTFRGDTVTTNAEGKARFTIGRKVDAKTYKAVARADGYSRAVARVTVT